MTPNNQSSGRWDWARGPGWWRELPDVMKAFTIIAMAFSAGMASYAWGTSRLEISGRLGRTIERVDTLEDWREDADVILIKAEGNRVLLGEHQVTLDSLARITQSMWCIAQADAHGLNPMLECYIPRPGREE